MDARYAVIVPSGHSRITEQRLVLVDGEQWPLSCGRLMLERDRRTCSS
jgi:hypothetical protein